VAVVNSIILKSSDIFYCIYRIPHLGTQLDEIIIEKLMERRDFYLYTLKHLSFQILTELTSEENNDYEKEKTNAIDQLKKIEQEIAFLLSKKES